MVRFRTRCKVIANILFLIFLALVSPANFAQKAGGGAAGQASAVAAGGSASAGQTAGSGGGGSAGGASAAGTSSLQGISYSRASWGQISALPAPQTFSISNKEIASVWDDFSGESFRKSVIVFCYTLKQNISGTDPFILEPTPPKSQNVSEYELCANQERSLHKSSSLVMGKFIIFRIDMSGIPPETLAKVQTLNLNIVSQTGASFNSQRGSTINPTTVRPSMALLSGPRYPCDQPTFPSAMKRYTLAGDELTYAFCPEKLPPVPGRSIVYLTWPGPLVGDTVPSVSINLIYTPVASALPLEPNTFYPAGSVVISKSDGSTNGHYYQALNGGTSDYSVPDFDQGLVEVPTFLEGGVYWRDRGRVPNGAIFPVWQKDTYFPKGTNVTPNPPPVHSHYYEAEIGGTSGSTQPNFPSDGSSIYDGVNPGLRWKEGGRVQPQSSGSPNQPAKPPTVAAKPSSPPNATASVSSMTPWTSGTAYVLGQQIVPPKIGNGHYYEAEEGGVSGEQPPTFPTDGKDVEDGTKKKFKWQDMGVLTIPAWQSGTAYKEGALVTPSPPNGFYYQALTSGVSGAFEPAFPTDDSVSSTSVVTESPGLIWMDIGASSTLPGAIKTLKSWHPDTAYALGDGLLDESTGHYYVAVQPGISGESEPPFSVPAPQVVTTKTVQWQDIGTTPPASVTVGAQPSDQLVSLLSMTFPQVQVLSRFNLTSGVIVSSLKPTSISSYTGSGPTTTSSGTGCPTGITSCTVYTAAKGSRLIDPVLGVTVYALKPFDAERPFRLTDLTPAPTLNISLSSPTTNYHIGFTSEFFVRNLQLVYGASIVQETRLAVPTTTFGTQVISLSTNKKTNYGGFVGMTFNITGFIQALIP